MKLKRFYTYAPHTLSDFWLMIATEIESALIQGGVPDKDYTAIQLFELARPFVLKRNQQGEGLDFVCSWPD